ncbi:hypothetical protein HRbin28_00062 [bacterium HR28]|nr:hypothetical protein HRbin28_00062 [bacterium HR28]
MFESWSILPRPIRAVNRSSQAAVGLFPLLIAVGNRHHPTNRSCFLVPNRPRDDASVH